MIMMMMMTIMMIMIMMMVYISANTNYLPSPPTPNPSPQKTPLPFIPPPSRRPMHQMQGRVIRSHHRQNPFLSQDKTKTFAGVNSEVFYYLFPNGFLHKIWRQLAFGQLRFVHRHFHCFSVSLSLSDAITIFAHCKECGGHFTLFIAATPQNSLICQTFRRLNRNVLKQFYIF